METKTKFKTFFLGLLLVNLVMSSGTVYAQTSTSTSSGYKGAQSDIERFLCSPTPAPASQQKVGQATTPANTGAQNPAGSDLYNCINRLYRFAIATASAVGVLMIVVAGYLYMSAEGNKEAVDKAKGIIVSTITALVLLFSSYVLLRAINPDLIAFQSIQPPSVSLPEASLPTFSDYTNGVLKEKIGEPVPASGVCKDATINLCQAVTGTCPSNACSNYDASIRKAADLINIAGVNEVALIKSIMYNESRCNVSAQSKAGACGLMQLLPETANAYKANCGVTEDITCLWLQNPANAEKSICIGAKYLQGLSRSSCGADVKNLAAGYNGGSKACEASVSCAGTNSCSGQPTRKWECLFNDTVHKVCNTGYTETRNYAPKVLGCYNLNNK